MLHTSSTRSPNLRRLAALAAVSTLALTACGGGSDDAEDAIDEFRSQISTPGPEGDGDDGDDGEQSGSSPTDDGPAEAQPPTFQLTGDVEAPDGWVEDPANCVNDEIGPPFFSYHVPADWENTGSGAAGSGGVGGSGNHTYRLPGGGSMELSVDTDSYMDGEPTDFEGKAWETWDYDITSYGSDGESSTRAEYEDLGPVEIDGETVDLWFLDQEQDDLISSSEYKTRVVFAEVPTGGAIGRDRQPYSATVTFEWNAERAEVREDDVRGVLETFRIPECTQEAMVQQFEMITGSDWSD